MEKEAILSQIKDAYQDIEILKNAVYFEMSDLKEEDKLFLLERHLISYEHAEACAGKGLLLSKDEVVSVMINEEDHLRMQVILSGCELTKAWGLLNKIDDELAKRLKFCYSQDLGFLTTCPTNTGTGLRVSCMLHLPALVLTKRINKILELVAKISFTTRGLFGEGTQALGDFFQVSNQLTLGISELELIANLGGLIGQIREQELDARQFLLKKHRFNLEDNIFRALGILKNARLVTSKEALSYLSMLSLGVDLGIINRLDSLGQNQARRFLGHLLVLIQPGHLQKLEGRVLSEKERDYIRAEILREKLAEFNN